MNAEDVSKNAIYVANESYWWHDPNIGDMHIRKGISRLRGGDPAVQANPQYWEPVQDNLTRDVEQATADPGEKRGAPVNPSPAAISSEAKAKAKGV